MADEKYRFEGNTLIINDGVTTIEGTDFHTYYEDNGYEGVKDEKFQNVKKIVLPDSVTEIGYDAFYDFTSLKDISLPNSITNISNYAFADCSSLESVIIPDSVTSIDWYAFMNCISLESVIIPDSVTSIDEFAFWGCENLTIVCNKGSYAEEFAAEKGIPVEYIDEKKYHIEGDTLVINDGVTTIDEADFRYNDDDGEPYTFDEIKNIQHIIIPNSVKRIDDNAFHDCRELISITIPDSVTYIADNAFNEWTEFTIVCNEGSYAAKYAEENDISVDLIDERIYHIEGDTLIIDKGYEEIDERDFGWHKGLHWQAKKELEEIKKIIIPDGVRIIDTAAFSGFTNLTDISIPDTVKVIGDEVFNYCESLTNIVLPDTIKEISSYAFCNCKNLKSITLPSNITYIGEKTFENCKNLTSVTIPSSVTSIADNAFDECRSLTIRCNKGSYAEKYAKENDIPVEYIGEHTKEQALSQIKDYINTLAEAMKHYDGKGDVGTYLEGYVGSSGTDLGAFLSETSAAYIRNCFVSAYSGVDFNYTEDKSPIERYETRINSAVDKATSLAEELVNKSEKTSVEEIVDDVMHNEDFKKILKNELKAENDYYFSQEDYDNRLDSYTEEYNETKAEILEDYKDDINSGKMNEQDINELIGTSMNTDYPVKEECAVYIRDIKDTILENGAGTLTLDDFGDNHYNVQIESDSEIYTFKVSLPVSKTVGGIKVQGFKELGYIDTGKDEVGKTLKEIAENTAVVTSRKNGNKSLNEIFKDDKGKTLD